MITSTEEIPAADLAPIPVDEIVMAGLVPETDTFVEVNNVGVESVNLNIPTHSPYRRTTDLLQRLAPGKMRIGFLLGAGCPLAIRTDTGPLIPDIAGVTTAVSAVLAADPKLKEIAAAIWKRVKERPVEKPTIEDILSHIRTLRSLCGTGSIDGCSATELDNLDTAICDQVRILVSKKLVKRDTPYHSLASWIQAIPRDKPVEVFTTNYDLLMEQAFEEQQVPYFDGFVGSDSAFLDLESMAVDKLPTRWARLWKVHGSVNWWLTQSKELRRSRDKFEGQQLLIYPSHLKYDQSRQMPYFAMLDRLRLFLSSEQSVLVICGYSFADEHINAFLGQGLSANPNASCVAMIWGDIASAPNAIVLAKRHANLTLLAADSGIVGTVQRNWDTQPEEEKGDANPAHVISVSAVIDKARSVAPENQLKWLLGDFAAFGQFLAHQLSSRNLDGGPSNGL